MHVGTVRNVRQLHRPCMSDAFLTDSVLITLARLIARSVSLSQPCSLERHQGRSDGGIIYYIPSQNQAR